MHTNRGSLVGIFTLLLERDSPDRLDHAGDSPQIRANRGSSESKTPAFPGSCVRDSTHGDSIGVEQRFEHLGPTCVVRLDPVEVEGPDYSP